MKLSKDFGVRGLLALLAAVGYYVPMIYVFIKVVLPIETIISLLAAAGSPWLLAMGFYFGSHIATKEQNGKPPAGTTETPH